MKKSTVKTVRRNPPKADAQHLVKMAEYHLRDGDLQKAKSYVERAYPLIDKAYPTKWAADLLSMTASIRAQLRRFGVEVARTTPKEGWKTFEQGRMNPKRTNPSVKSQRKAVRKGMDPVKHAGGSPYTRADDRIERDGQAWEYRGEFGNVGTARAGARGERLDTGRKTLVIQRGPFVGTLFGTPTRFHVWTLYVQEGTAPHRNPGRRKKNPVTHGDDVMKPYNWQKKEDEYQGAGSRKLHEWATEAIASRDSADAEAKRAEDARVVSSRELEMAKERYAPLELAAKNAYQVYSWHADDASTIGMEKRRAAERLKKTKEWAESELAEMHMNPRKGRVAAKRRNPLPGPDALQGLKPGDRIRITTDLSDRVSTYTVLSKKFTTVKAENDMSGGKVTIDEDSIDRGTLVIYWPNGAGRILTLQRANGGRKAPKVAAAKRPNPPRKAKVVAPHAGYEMTVVSVKPGYDYNALPGYDYMETDRPGIVLIDGHPVAVPPATWVQYRAPGSKYVNGRPVYAEGSMIWRGGQPPHAGDTIKVQRYPKFDL